MCKYSIGGSNYGGKDGENFIRILIIQFICLSVVQLLFIHKSSVKYLSKIVYYEGVMVKDKAEILQVNR